MLVSEKPKPEARSPIAFFKNITTLLEHWPHFRHRSGTAEEEKGGEEQKSGQMYSGVGKGEAGSLGSAGSFRYEKGGRNGERKEEP